MSGQKSRLAADDIPAPRIPDYQVRGLIGRGAFGQVWLAEETLTHVKRALKFLPKAGFMPSYDPMRELAGIREYQQRAKGHPALIQIFHVAEYEESYYYVMELADNAEPSNEVGTGSTGAEQAGGYRALTLDLLIKRTAPMPAEQALGLIAIILDGLDHLHRSGLIHRDVKPSNVLFVDGVPKLADMGLVTTTDRDVSIVGTPGYIPPDATIDQTTDLYATGVMLYEMITGLHRSRFPELPVLRPNGRRQRRLLRNAIHIANKAAQHDRRRRYATAAQFLRDVNAGRPHGFSRRHWKAIAALIGLAVVIGSATALRPTARRLVSLEAPAEMGHVLTLHYERGDPVSLRLPEIVTFATIVDFAGRQHPLVAIGTRWDGPKPGCLIVMDPTHPETMVRHPVLELDLFKHPPWTHQEFVGPCSVHSVIAVDLDNRPGDELIVCAVHNEGPVRWVFFDAHLKPISEYWHYGHLGSAVVGDICGDPRPEVLCWGLANERAELPQDKAIFENYYPAVMIVDPFAQSTGYWSMNDWMNDLEHPPIAYGHVPPAGDSTGRAHPRLQGLGEFTINRRSRYPIRAHSTKGLLLEFDAGLNLRQVRLGQMDASWRGPIPETEEVWKRTWPRSDDSVTDPVVGGE
jgi:serine/threonine protein kinase